METKSHSYDKCSDCNRNYESFDIDNVYKPFTDDNTTINIYKYLEEEKLRLNRFCKKCLRKHYKMCKNCRKYICNYDNKSCYSCKSSELYHECVDCGCEFFTDKFWKTRCKSCYRKYKKNNIELYHECVDCGCEFFTDETWKTRCQKCEILF